MSIKRLYAPVSPGFNFNFVNSNRIDPAIRHSRASTATYIDEDGLLKTAPVNTPRFEHDPVTGANKGFLIESQRTNILPGSNLFLDGSFWAFGDSATTKEAAGSNKYGNIFRIFNLPAGTPRHYRTAFNVSFSSGIVYTFSCNLKADSGTPGVQVSLVDTSVGARTALASVNFSEGIPLEDGWRRVSVTLSTTTGAGNFLRVDHSNANSYFIQNPQLEAGSFDTSYIPTNGTVLTRSADVISWFLVAPSEIRSLYAEFIAPGVGLRGITSLDNDTANERIEIVTSGTSVQFSATSSGVTQAQINTGTALGSQPSKVATTFASGFFSASLNGAAPVTVASGNLPVVTGGRIGSNQAGNAFNGTIGRLAGWNTTLSGVVLQNLTVS